jgi:hypothetical protein
MGVALRGLSPAGSQRGTETGIYFPGPEPITINLRMLYEKEPRRKREIYINHRVLY